jgi:hypothetical protein
VDRYTVYTIECKGMSKHKDTSKETVVSFRTAKEIKDKADREAKKRKQTRSEFVEAIFVSALEAAIAGAK